MKKTRYKPGDIVLVKSPAGDCIPMMHVKLLKRVIVESRKGRKVGLKTSMDWPGYSGWDATPVFQEEIDILRKEWSIPFTAPGADETWVYDRNIVKKPRHPTPNIKKPLRKKGSTLLRKKSKKGR